MDNFRDFSLCGLFPLFFMLFEEGMVTAASSIILLPHRSIGGHVGSYLFLLRIFFQTLSEFFKSSAGP